MSSGVRLALGQLSVWHDIRDLPRHRWHEPNNAALWPLPEGADADHVRRALRTVVARHPSLRLRYDLTDAATRAPRQLPPDPDWNDALPAVELDTAQPARAEAQSADLATQPFDLTREHGWRARLLTRRGRPTHLAFAKHHIAADAWAQELLRAEFIQALTAAGDRAGSAARTQAGAGTGTPAPAAPGPAELAAEQHSTAGLRRQAAALDHWARTFEAAAPAIALPRATATPGAALQGTLRSAPALHAARLLAERAQTSVAAVVLAAYARSVARRCHADTLLVQLMSANRFAPRWRDLVTSMNQWVPALIPHAREENLARLARAAHWSSLTACRHGMHDVTAVDRLRARTPGAAEPACAFNYVATPGDSPATLTPPPYEPTLTWERPFTTIGPRCYARASDADGVLTVRLTARDLVREEAAALLEDLHDGLLAAAGRPATALTSTQATLTPATLTPAGRAYQARAQHEESGSA
ncbi:condensation domain-containing protein [Streptomyces pathocidini]|uniref:Condensation domain-containing protein n=3 Tax=Streptomyces pathocidini TaxID=1650571 RepID=A0ABW7UX96_9ACTN